MPIPNLSRSVIQQHTTGGSFERGEQYRADGSIRSVKQTDEHTIKAQVQGSDVHPYLVTITFDETGIQKVTCTCPYHEGSWCKHIAAVLLEVLETDSVPTEEPAQVADLIDELDRPALVTLIERLVEHDPDLLDQIERERSRLTGEG
jgi:uncharacterized Zn finger protein